MRLLLSVLLILSCLSSFAASRWSKLYSLVNKDIASIEKLKTKDLGLRVRLFELYGEKLTLLIEKENEYRINYIESGNTKNLDKVMRLQKNTLERLDAMARIIERQTKKSNILTKISYYRSINYYLVKDYKNFYRQIKSAERLNRDPKLEYLINTKLADFHYNENQYKKSTYYYLKLIKNTKNTWLTKHYYNLAWSELKLGRFQAALKHLKIAHNYDKKKGYFKIGDQLVDALLLFHAYANQTQSGLKYLKNQKLDSFDNYIKYLHYVFEHGSKRSTGAVIAQIDQTKKTLDQEFIFLDKKIVVYRALKKFRLLQRDFVQIKKVLKQKSLSEIKKKTREDLKASILSYTGYLQEIVKSKRLVSKKVKNNYVRYIAYNFNVLKEIDPENALEFSYYEGETYFSIKDYKRASFVYASGLQTHLAKKGKSNKFVIKSYDSLFKSLENQKKPSSKILFYALSSYLELYPRGPKSQLVYQRLVNFHQTNGETAKMLETLRSYNLAYPKDNKLQRDYYKAILNKYIDKNNIKALNSLKGLVAKGFLSFPSTEVAKIQKIITQISFAAYEDLAAKGKVDEAIAGFHGLFVDKKTTYNLRVEAVRKELFYLSEKLDYKTLAVRIVDASKFYNKVSKIKYGKELIIYTQNICIGDQIDECLMLVDYFSKDPATKLSNNLKDLYFRMYVSKTGNFKQAYSMANSTKKLNFLFKVLLLEDSDFKSPLYQEFYQEKSTRSIIDNEIERTFIVSFYKRLKFDKFESWLAEIALPNVKSTYFSKVKGLRQSFKVAGFTFPEPPKDADITPEVFGKFGMDFNQSLTGIIKNLNNEIKFIDPNFRPYLLSLIIKSFEREVSKFKRFIPVSKDTELEKAMSDEIANLHQFLDQKVIEYRQLYYETIDKTSPFSGAKKYYENLMANKISHGFKDVGLWQN